MLALAAWRSRCCCFSCSPPAHSPEYRGRDPTRLFTERPELVLRERLLVRPGEYVLTVKAEGYHPYEQAITVTEAETQRFDISGTLPGTVSIISTPRGQTPWTVCRWDPRCSMISF